MKTYQEYCAMLSKHQNMDMLTPMQVNNICRAMADLELELSPRLLSRPEETKQEGERATVLNARKIDAARLLSVLLTYQAKMNEDIIDYIKKNQ